jgi:outer membrane protein OmpA-like peptidoglycan-associated protein
LKTISSSFGLGFGLLVTLVGAAGCATVMPPAELTSARTVYDRASKGPAASLNPTDLHTAKESLDAAEQSFVNEGDTQVTRDLGYTAERRSETAESRARAMIAITEKDQAIAGMHSATEARGKMTAAELAAANLALAGKDQALAGKDMALQAQGNALQNEVQRRKDAEARAAQAAADLARLASVKQETRGMVITLSGSVLFTSGKSDLLPAAQLKLNDVAKALIDQDPESKMVVEGHTDSQGTLASNQELSQKRAQAVRDYLVSRGIAGDRVTAAGYGPTRPIGENTSAEGRANNRRVEIVVQPKK